MTSEKLKELQGTIPDDEERVDIKDVYVNMSVPAAERTKQYLLQIKNPYYFKYGNVKVNVQFNPEGKTFRQALTSYLISLTNN